MHTDTLRLSQKVSGTGDKPVETNMTDRSSIPMTTATWYFIETLCLIRIKEIHFIIFNYLALRAIIRKMGNSFNSPVFELTFVSVATVSI